MTTISDSRATDPASAPALAWAAGTNAYDYLAGRGFVQDVTDADGLRAAFAAGTVTAYIGFDPTAPSLHVGNLVGVMMLASLQRLGHRPLALGGGGTALVGDPSGKTSTRKVTTAEQIETNLAGMLPQFGRYLSFDGDDSDSDGHPPALLLNNADWLLDLPYIAFLRDIGRHFSVNEMLAVETYRNRLATTGLNFVEFNYRLLQAYDFLHLFRTEGCTLQMGGSDQWANIDAGKDLIRKADGGRAFGLTSPLITTSSGAKMGKSEDNAVWLDAGRTSPFEYYQFWVNTEDADVARFLRLYTFLPEERIVGLTAEGGAALREAKVVLAHEATALTHGVPAADEVRAASRAVFGGRRSPGVGLVADGAVPMTEIPVAEVRAGLTVAEAFVRAGLCSSRGEARRLAAQGGISVDGQSPERVDDPLETVVAGLHVGATVLLRVGRKRARLLRVV